MKIAHLNNCICYIHFKTTHGDFALTTNCYKIKIHLYQFLTKEIKYTCSSSNRFSKWLKCHGVGGRSITVINSEQASLLAQMAMSLPAMQEIWVWSLGREHTLDKGLATQPGIPAWEIPWTESGRLQSMRS